MATTSIIPQNTTYLQNGMRWDTNQVSQLYGLGVPQSPMYLYNVIPAAPVDNYVAAAQAWVSANPITLTTANAITYLGNYPVVQLDCQRSLTITIIGGPTTAGTTITVQGWDDRNVAVTSTGTLPTATAAGTYELGVGGNMVTSAQGKCFSMIQSVTLSATPGVNFSIGTGSRIGLPYFAPLANYMRGMSWNGVSLNPYGTVFVPGFQFNPIAVNPAPLPYPVSVTASTTDARGFVDLNNSGGATLPDGSLLLSVYFYVYGADSYLQAQLTNQVPSAIGQTNIGGYTSPGVPATNPAGGNVISYNQFQMLAWDEVGVQYPGGV